MKNRISKVFKGSSLSFVWLLAFFYSISLHSEEEDFRKYAMFASNAERPESTNPIPSRLPFTLQANARIALLGNTLFDRMRNFGHFEAILQKAHPDLNLVLGIWLGQRMRLTCNQGPPILPILNNTLLQ